MQWVFNRGIERADEDQVDRDQDINQRAAGKRNQHGKSREVHGRPCPLVSPGRTALR